MTAIKYPPPRSKRWAFMEWTDIPSKVDRSAVYLRRLRIFNTPLVSAYVHWIYEPDTDRDPHDHPWNFLSLILRGGYVERVWPSPQDAGRSALRFHSRGEVHRTATSVAHSIEQLIDGTVTGRGDRSPTARLGVLGNRRGRGLGALRELAVLPRRDGRAGMTDEIIAEPEAPLYTVEEFGGSRRLYPAELTFEPPRHGGKSALQPCGATYGLLIAHGFIKLTCALQRHDRPRKMDGRDVPDNSWHVAPLLDGNFRWPPGATGAPEEK